MFHVRPGQDVSQLIYFTNGRPDGGGEVIASSFPTFLAPTVPKRWGTTGAIGQHMPLN